MTNKTMTDKTLMHESLPNSYNTPTGETLELVKSFALIQDADRRRQVIDFARKVLIADTQARLN